MKAPPRRYTARRPCGGTASAGAPDVIYLVPHPAVEIAFLKAWTAAGTGKFAGQWYPSRSFRTETSRFCEPSVREGVV